MLPPRKQHGSTQLEDETTPWTFWASYAIKPTGGTGGCNLLVRVTDPDYHGEIGLLLQNAGKTDYIQQ